MDAAKHVRRQAEARAAALEEELAHLDQEAPLPTDAAGARARTLRLLRRLADAGAVPATDPATDLPEPAPRRAHPNDLQVPDSPAASESPPLPCETEAALVAYIERWARIAWRASSAPAATGGS